MNKYDAGLLSEARAIRREADAINRFVDEFLAIKYGRPGDTPPAVPVDPNGPPSGSPVEQNADPAPYVDEEYGYGPPISFQQFPVKL